MSRDLLGEKEDANLYRYVFGNPTNFMDPLGLKTYMCKRPLGDHGAPSDNQRNGPDITGNPLYHQYYCVQIGGVMTCYGQAASGNPISSPGRPTTPKDGDVYDPNRCQELPGNDCFDKCMERKGREPRPRYGIPFGQDCQDWSDKNEKECKKECKLK